MIYIKDFNNRIYFFLIGKKIVIFWIRLENIVNVGVIEIVYIYFVDWVVGDVVVIVIINYRYC